VRFWDSSALVPLLVDEPGRSEPLRRLFADERPVVVWWGTRVECASSVARLERLGALTAWSALTALRLLDELAERWSEVSPSAAIQDLAIRLLRLHTLHAGDALQLAAALQAADSRPSDLDFVCLDEQLIVAAQREGLSVLGDEALAGRRAGSPRPRRRRGSLRR